MIRHPSPCHKMHQNLRHQRARLDLLLSGAFIGRSVNVPVDFVTTFFSGCGGGSSACTVDDEGDPDKGGGGAGFMFSTSSNLAGSGTANSVGADGSICSLEIVSLGPRDLPPFLHSRRIASRPFVSGHCSTCSITRFRGVVPVETSSCVP